jgi:hypothetical protein
MRGQHLPQPYKGSHDFDSATLPPDTLRADTGEPRYALVNLVKPRSYWKPSNSTSKIRVALGGIAPG